MPEFVEPKQLKQTQVLVKHARLITRRSAARPTEESKATSESTQKGRQGSKARRSQAFDTRLPKKEDGGGAELIGDQQTKKTTRVRIGRRKKSGEHQSEEIARAGTNRR